MQLRLQARYAVAITALILVVSTVVAFTMLAQFHRATGEMTAASLVALETTLTRELEEQGGELAQFLAEDLGRPLAEGDRGAIIAALRELPGQEKALRRVTVLDKNGAPVATSGIGAENTGDLLFVTRPVINRGNTVGSVQLGFTLDGVHLRRGQLAATLSATGLRSMEQQQLHLVAIFLLLAALGVLLGMAMARRLARPVQTLAGQVRDFAAGDLHRPLAPVDTHDEIAEVAAAFEQLRHSLSATAVSRDFLHRILDSLHEGLVVTGTDGKIRLINRAAAEMFGYPAAELAGTPLAFLLPELSPLAAGDHLVMEHTLKHRDGHPIPVEISRSRISSGSEAELVYVISDIGERRQLEGELWAYRSQLEHLVVERTKELVAAIQELESFSYSVSHDLHAPLRAINGFGAALREEYRELLDETGRGYLARIDNATVRMGELIDGLLSLTRVVRSELHREPVDLSALASELTAELAASEPRRQATFRIAPMVRVAADRTQMRLLLQNLLANAWKFTRRQRHALIEFGQVERERGRVFFVRDNGAGFDARSAQKLFQPFHRLHDDKEFPGTGIGLATVKRVAARHGGEVWAEAGPGAGATFYFTIPEEPPAQVEESRVSSRAPLSNSISSQRPSRTA